MKLVGADSLVCTRHQKMKPGRNSNGYCKSGFYLPDACPQYAWEKDFYL